MSVLGQAPSQIELMINTGDKDLATLNAQVASTLANIYKWYDDHVLYWGMMAQSRNDLEWRLYNVKVPDKLNHWAPGITYNLDDIILPTVLNNYCYVANPAGVSGATEPVWPTTVGATVVDGAVTWTCNYYTWPVYYGPTYGIGNIWDWEVRYNNGASPGVIYSPTVAWDGDTLLTQYNGDYSAIYPMVYGTPFGTIAMLAALTTAYNTLVQRRNEVAAKNNVLIHYETYDIEIIIDGPGTTIPVAGISTVDWGTDLTVYFAGTVDHVMVDDIDVGTMASYTFTHITADHVLMVYFV